MAYEANKLEEEKEEDVLQGTEGEGVKQISQNWRLSTSWGWCPRCNSNWNWSSCCSCWGTRCFYSAKVHGSEQTESFRVSW